MSSFTVRLNPMRLSQLAAFYNIHGRIHNDSKDVFFIEWLGLPEEAKALCKTLIQAQARAHILIRLDTRPTPEQAAHCAQLADALLHNLPFSFAHPMDPRSAARLPDALREMLAYYRANQPQASDSMVRNCAVRLLCALLDLSPKLFPTASLPNDQPKCIWLGEPDSTARLLLSLLPQIGCDVAVIRPDGTQPLFPQAIALTGIPDADFNPVQVLEAVNADAGTTSPITSTASPSASVVLSIPRHPKRSSQPAGCRPPVVNAQTASSPPVKRQLPASNPLQTPLDPEALAALAPSVVMIEVLDEDGATCSSGSGVLITASGIILTNFHVVSHGTAYAIHLENNQTVFHTDELLKYHTDYDLALLRLPDCHVPPIPLYQGNGLARGQQVFAIGSPLGLFNSVSDGIISGFRTIHYHDMIQFTAPTSPGSSGGALLDRCGQLIGIVTAGYSDGQNLNLAVSYQTIRQFTHGFL